jgi:gliding motility-associated-like protein
MKKLIHFFYLAVLLLACTFSARAQTYTQITHNAGGGGAVVSQLYGTNNVGVGYTGSCSTGGGQCFSGNGTYWAGQAGAGQYNFTFSQPVGTIKLRVEGLNPTEYVQIYINGILFCVSPCNVDCGYTIICGAFGGILGFQQNCNYYGPNTQYGGGQMLFPAGNITSFGVWCNGTLAGTDFQIFFSNTVNPNSGCSGCFSAHSNSQICQGQTLNLWCDTLANATGYQWWGPNGFTGNGQYVSLNNAPAAASGVYTVVGTIPGGHDTAVTTVVVVGNHNPGFIATPNPGCVGGPITVTGNNTNPASPASDYSWVSLGGTPATATGTQTFTTAFPNPGSKQIILNYTDSGCVFADTQSVQIDPPFTLNITSNSPICDGGDLHLSSTSITGGTYAWTGVNGFTSTDQNPVLTGVSFPQGGEYYLTVTQPNGCFATDSANVVILPMPAVPSIATNSPLCIDGVLRMNANSDPGSLYSWTGPNGFTASTQTVALPQFRAENAGKYFVTANLQGCKTTDSTTVSVKDPSFTIISDTTVCFRDSAVFTYVGPFLPGSGTTYNWVVPHASSIDSGSGSPRIQVVFDSIGIQAVSLSVSDSATQCYDITNLVNIFVAAPPVATIDVPKDACINTEVPITVSYATSDITSYQWDFGGGVVAEGSGGGPYKITYSSIPASGWVPVTLQATSKYGCPAALQTDSLKLHSVGTAIATTPPSALCAGDTLVLAVDSSSYDVANHYQWSPKQYFYNGGVGGKVTAVMSSSSDVTVTVTDAWGCVASASKQIDVQPCCVVSFPNAFTPNNLDGLNLKFRPITIGNHKISEFVVMNRWGQVVFRGGSDKAAWDGTMNGIPQDMGVYNWYIKYECNGKLMEEKGDVTLIR